MHLVRFLDPAGGPPRPGVLQDSEVHAVAGAPTLASLLRRPLGELRRVAEAALEAPGVRDPQLLAPIDGLTEVWGAGVTYEVSKTARVEETQQQTRTVYEQVYDAERPELFFKSVAWRVVTTGEPIAVRADSPNNVPEPELAVVANADAEIVGFTVCNDLTARAIEGQNPLYLPQAKLFSGSTALAPGIRPVWEVPDPSALEVRMVIRRAGAPAWEGTTPTSRIRRRLQDLVDVLFSGDWYPDGLVLSTGTGLVPPLTFTIEPGDQVEIEVPSVGLLRNPVLLGKDGHRRLTERGGER
ncbi:MAG: fumarylacetoacetate hydrolase family protein [Candidatus Dormibacteraceae bacterium]